MKKTLLTALMALTAIGGFSQSIYEIADLSTTDLNGTSRFIGMGGAMSSLGGDLSTMSTNPAAIGLYRKSDVAVTTSLVTQPGGRKFDGKNKTFVSFDQLGFVYSFNVDDSPFKFINVGINYHKQHDFNRLVASSMNDLSGNGYASQTWQLSDLSNYWLGADQATPLANMAYQAYLLGDAESGYSPYGASSHYFNKAQWGSNQAFDINLSFNINDRVYLGLTATGHNVVNKSSSAYTEDLVQAFTASNLVSPDGFYTLTNYSSLKGFGYDAKFGIIVRPIATSNFKVGLSFTLPTHYELTYRNEAILGTYENQWGDYDVYGPYIDYDYKIRTPWKFNLSVANTFFNKLALGAEYEYADYSTASVSYGDEWDDWDISKDRELNHQADKYLKGTHTLKLGAELTPVRNLYLRAGYNYVSSPFDKNAHLNQFINSASVDAATSTDYLNTSAINRYTLGLGFKIGSFYADAVWQYQRQHGDFYAFSALDSEPDFDKYYSYNVPNSRNACPKQRVGISRSRIGLTIGYRF